MSNLREVLNTWDNADSELNKKIDEKANLSSIVASAVVSATNSKTVEINGTGKAVEKLVVEGKTVQDGTPSPDNPIEVKGVGELVNLFDTNALDRRDGHLINDSGTEESTARSGYTLNFTKVKPNTVYTRSGEVTSEPDSWRVYFYDKNKQWISRTEQLRSSDKSFTTPVNCEYIRIQYIIAVVQFDTIQIEEGSIETPYVPYGKYKIPISSGGKSTNIYLNAPLFDGDIADLVGGVADKKYGMVALADLAWSTSGSGGFLIANLINAKMPVNGNTATNAICTHYVAKAYTPIVTGDTAFALYDNKIYIPNHSGTVPAPTEGYLLYELATPTKETFDGAEIPTTVGKNTLTIGTDVTPASIEATSFGDYYSKAEADRIIDEKVDRKIENKQWKYGDMIANVLETSTLTNIDFSKYSEILVMAIANSTTALYTSIFPAYMVYSGYNCRVNTEDSSKYVNVKFSNGSTVITLPSNINSVRILAH